jgi:CheY-like chemotaxis protein
MFDLSSPVSGLLDSTHGKPKLLVVDDQPINIQVMYQAFAGEYQVFMATSGEQALIICKSNPPDLILLDEPLSGLDPREQVRIRFLGDLEQLPPGLQELIASATRRTAENTGIHFNVCTNYGGRRELVQAARRLADQVARGELDPASIDEQAFAAELQTADEVDPDLLIRTSGEYRISNFLLWQLAYAEIHITDVLWPDFNEDALLRALSDYQNRQRRFGGVAPLTA